ncbi:stage V sporulation T C-terminal domain-containing protein [Bengtsoniella intestinalis]|uniref:stage V sporulation T C-terminal domain-containing protein n=1 Tax=Bengtsoniella intestinalis TaxID=3073143 RepID=UPI00391EF53C
MKATGIVRRIDDLGRVVIPKEIRRTMRIREGDPLEIYTSREGEVIFKKYSQLGGVDSFATELCEALSRTSGVICAISDRDAIIAVAGGNKRELLGRAVSPQLETLMEQRSAYQYAGQSTAIPVTDISDALTAAIMVPILSEGDVLGAVVLIAEEGQPTGEPELKTAQTLATFLGKHMEN